MPSQAHEDLILKAVHAIQMRYSNLNIVTDLRKKIGDEVPKLINGFRPDVYAEKKTLNELIVIAEAKTDNDIENRHSHNQIEAFLHYLEEKKCGVFVLSVSGFRADYGKSFLLFKRDKLNIKHTKLAVFDSYDLWILGKFGDRFWHLN